MPVTIRRPVVIARQDRPARTPNPAEVVRVEPVAVGIEIFSTPNVLVEILNVVAESLGEIPFPIPNPIVGCVGWCGSEEFPVAGVFTGNYQLR